MLHDLARGAKYQQYLFVILSLLVLLLSVDILGLLGVGDPKASGAMQLPASKTAAWNLLDPGARQMLEREHEAIVAEIRLRIEQEHLLFALKFVLVGGILWAFIQTAFGRAESEFTRTPFAALSAWAAVVAASIVDLRVMANQTFLITLGGWTRQYEQLALGSNGAQLGWEAFLADNLLSKSYYPALRVNGQILTALLFSVTALLFLLRVDGKNDPNTARISAASGIVAIWIMTMAGLSLRHASLDALIDVAAGFFAVVIVAVLAHWSHRNHHAPGGS
ncbi:MAG TPA: hypothetical protein VNA69_24505 [Thermoanaerobaculia bacterium]|nr:hypothetical protein [Thermoanaerobaculia bacterium]